MSETSSTTNSTNSSSSSKNSCKLKRPCLRHYLVSTFLLLILDSVFIWLFLNKNYAIMVDKIQDTPMAINFFYAVPGYLAYIFALNYFSLNYVDPCRLITSSFSVSGVLGGTMKSAYAFSAASLFNYWDFKLIMADIFWGMFMFTVIPMIVLTLFKVDDPEEV